MALLLELWNKAGFILVAATLAISPLRAAPADAYPPITGSYVPLRDHPGVFITSAELHELAGRIGLRGSFSAQVFSRLVTTVRSDLRTPTRWDVTYSGDDIDVYLHTFSFEPRGGYKGQSRSDDQLRAALHLGPSERPPAGAAVVAARLALYAALAQAGAPLPTGAPSPAQAAALAKRILLAWADHGFRDKSGHFRTNAAQFCVNGRYDVRIACVGLQVARGVNFSVHAQDLLEGLHELDASERSRLDAFHRAMFDLIRNSSNAEWAAGQRGPYPDMSYNNQFANHLTALLAIARLLDDRARFEAVLSGDDPQIPVGMPWVSLFNHLIHGAGDAPWRIQPNSGPDGLTSRPAFTTPAAAPGEINDRYRNSNPLQGMGYPMFALTLLDEASEVLGRAGFDGYGYRGVHGQSIELAADYYAQYGTSAGFYGTVTPQNSAAIPDYAQYAGKVVNGLEINVLIGCRAFPHDAALTRLESAARATVLARPGPPDAVVFGKWRN